MGSSPGGSGFPPEMYGVLASDHGSPQAGGKKYKANHEKSLKHQLSYGMIVNRDILLDLFL